jgi:hypothetical protein
VTLISKISFILDSKSVEHVVFGPSNLVLLPSGEIESGSVEMVNNHFENFGRENRQVAFSTVNNGNCFVNVPLSCNDAISRISDPPLVPRLVIIVIGTCSSKDQEFCNGNKLFLRCKYEVVTSWPHVGIAQQPLYTFRVTLSNGSPWSDPEL